MTKPSNARSSDGSTHMSAARAPAAQRQRWRAHHVLLLALAGACTQSLGLDDYTFVPRSNLGGSGGLTGAAGSSGNGQGGSGTGGAGAGDVGFDPDGGLPDGGSFEPDASDGNDGGASGSTGSAGSSGNGGASGSGSGGAGNAGAGGASGAGGVAGASGAAGAGGSGGSSGGACGSGSVCVPTFPFGWVGPIAVSRGGASGCPTGYATAQGDIFANLQPGAVTCGCDTCEVDPQSFECHLQMSDGNLFIPPSWEGLDGAEEECASPPRDDELLTLVPVATCSARTVETRTVSTWGSVEKTCGGAASTGSCAGGSCYPGAGSFEVCIAQDGDHLCPSGFGARAVYYTSFSDTRVCSACSCDLQADQACEMNIEICHLGGIDPLQLHSYGQTEVQLSNDAPGVTILDWSAVDIGNCDAYGGAVTGAITPTNPVTVCCL